MDPRKPSSSLSARHGKGLRASPGSRGVATLASPTRIQSCDRDAFFSLLHTAPTTAHQARILKMVPFTWIEHLKTSTYQVAPTRSACNTQQRTVLIVWSLVMCYFDSGRLDEVWRVPHEEYSGGRGRTHAQSSVPCDSTGRGWERGRLCPWGEMSEQIQEPGSLHGLVFVLLGLLAN